MTTSRNKVWEISRFMIAEVNAGRKPLLAGARQPKLMVFPLEQPV